MPKEGVPYGKKVDIPIRLGNKDINPKQFLTMAMQGHQQVNAQAGMATYKQPYHVPLSQVHARSPSSSITSCMPDHLAAVLPH